ncbi:MAG: acyl carrier protein [Lachnospiraceae bacterium]|nr:acyl carrier protein [Lachnospiraceae bacterium]MBQ6311972.1 acyl carrier protein [Lachnospiraceae bacterium]MBQ6354758.1 acyl carrier protein [Lachnospiraceae bacterium]MBR2753140.1 acyl carrier protein [Lachnospiraceae bacterium]
MEFEKLREIIEDVLHIEKKEITPETTLIEDLCADSLDLYEIVSEIGLAFEVEITTEEVNKMETVGDILRAIQGSGREI